MSAQPHKRVVDLAAAFVLLTRLPLRWDRFSNTEPDFQKAVWAFPVVGGFVGLCGAVALALALTASLPPLVAASLATAVMILVTGAFHEDGLADVADGFGGGRTLERKLEIMRDSRVGTYGIVALVLSLILQISCLASLPLPKAAAALVITAMMSRLVLGYVMRYQQPARQDGLAHDTGKPETERLIWGTALTLIVAIILADTTTALLCMAVAAAASLAVAGIAQRQIKGFTGDVLGTVQQVSGISVLLLLTSLG